MIIQHALVNLFFVILIYSSLANISKIIRGKIDSAFSCSIKVVTVLIRSLPFLVSNHGKYENRLPFFIKIILRASVAEKGAVFNNCLKYDLYQFFHIKFWRTLQ